MHFKYATTENKAAVRHLWEAAFSEDSPAYIDWYFREVYCADKTLCAFDETEQLTACLQIAPYQLSLHGRRRSVAYLVGVTTARHLRHQGIGHQLLKRALHDLKEAGCEMVLLHTDKPGFYEPLGFSHCYFLQRLHMQPCAGAIETTWRTGLADEQEICTYADIYRTMCRSFNGYIVRSPADWHKFLADHLTDTNSFISYTEKAYILYSYIEQQLYIRELGYANSNALCNALALVQALAAQKHCQDILWDAPLNLPLPQTQAPQIIPYIMARTLLLPNESANNTVVAETQNLLGLPDNRLWLNEIT